LALLLSLSNFTVPVSVFLSVSLSVSLFVSVSILSLQSTEKRANCEEAISLQLLSIPSDHKFRVVASPGDGLGDH